MADPVKTVLPPPTMVTSNTSSGIAAALVVIINWFLAHLETDWVMPAEVAAALQFIITYAVGEWVVASKNKSLARQHDVAQAVLAAPDPRTAAESEPLAPIVLSTPAPPANPPPFTPVQPTPPAKAP